MYTENRKHKQRDRDPDREKRKPRPEHIRKRLNPRLVFNDPDIFFHDLLMEQQEQQ